MATFKQVAEIPAPEPTHKNKKWPAEGKATKRAIKVSRNGDEDLHEPKTKKRKIISENEYDSGVDTSSPELPQLACDKIELLGSEMSQLLVSFEQWTGESIENLDFKNEGEATNGNFNYNISL